MTPTRLGEATLLCLLAINPALCATHGSAKPLWARARSRPAFGRRRRAAGGLGAFSTRPPSSERRHARGLAGLRATEEKEEQEEQEWKPQRQPAPPETPEPPSEPTPPSELDSIVERTLDTVEDAVSHARRVPYDLGWTGEAPDSFRSDGSDGRETIVVLGSGWAAHALLKVADTFKVRLVVVSPSNHFVFTPMLASAAVGTVEYRSMSEAVRAANPMVDYVEGHAVDVDVEKKVVKVELESLLDDVREGKPPVINLSYDRLVVAVGCKVADGIVPGAKEHALRLKSCDDARRLRTAVGECLEYASRPDVTARADLSEEESSKRQQERRSRATFAIVGGGPTGAELAGELMDFLNDVRRSRVGAYARLKDDVKIMLIHGGSDLVPQFDKDLRGRALQSLRKEGVDVRLRTRVKEVGDGFVKIAKKGEEDNVETVQVGLTVWAAGTAPVDFVQTLLTKLPPEAAGKGGRVKVDSWFRCPMPSEDLLGSVLVLGDAALFQDQKSGFEFLPQTAQVAGQQGAHAARLISRGYDLTQTPPALSPGDASPLSKWLRFRGSDVAPKFSFLNLGQLAYVGGGKALSEIQIGDIPILKYAGSVSYVLWRSVYLVKQVATRNRVLVTFDWFKSTVFGRDVTRL